MNCMILAFSQLLEMSYQQLASAIEFDEKKAFPGTSISKSPHVQEILDVSSKMGIWFSPIELVPQSTNGKRVFQIFFGDGTVSANFERFKGYLNAYGVIQGSLNEVGHAVFFDGMMCHDHRGVWRLWDDAFVPGVFWRAVYGRDSSAARPESVRRVQPPVIK